MPEPPSEGLTVIKDFAKAFYNSQAWKQTSKAYAKSKRNLCEICAAQGLITPCEIVHHKVFLTPNNINDTSITLDWNNLQAVCREHHAAIHGKRKRRYKIDEYGRVIAKWWEKTEPLKTAQFRSKCVPSLKRKASFVPVAFATSTRSDALHLHPANLLLKLCLLLIWSGSNISICRIPHMRNRIITASEIFV